MDNSVFHVKVSKKLKNLGLYLGIPVDPYPIPTRTQHVCQPVPYTNSYHIPNTCKGVVEQPRQGRARKRVQQASPPVVSGGQAGYGHSRTLGGYQLVTSFNTLLVPYT